MYKLVLFFPKWNHLPNNTSCRMFLSEWAKVMREIQPVVLAFLQLPYHFASTSLAVFLFFVCSFIFYVVFSFCPFLVPSFLSFFHFLPFFLCFLCLCLYLSLSSLSVSLTTKTIFKLQLTPTSVHF